MGIKIENKKVTPFTSGRGKKEFRNFVIALRDLKVGQSFLWKLESNDRMAISIVQTLLDVQIITRKEGDMFRIGRTV